MAPTTFTQKTGPQVTIKSALGPVARYLIEPIYLFRGYDRGNFRPDLVAGLTVAVILLPQAIAFALIAELPPEMGLYAAVIGGLAGALWGSSNQIHNGPTNAISLLVLSTLSSTAVPGTPEYILAAATLALMVGIFQLLLGPAKLGVLVNFVSHSVIVGFASGAGVLILIKQIAPLLGLNISAHNTFETALGVVDHFPEAHWITAAIGIGTVIFLIILRRINPSLPAALMAMVIASLIVFLFGADREGVAVIGSLPSGFPPPTDFSSVDMELVRKLITGAIAVGAIGLVETTAISKSVAAQTRQRLDSNQEFVGQGMANALCGIFSGYPVAGSFSRTAVNFRAGARTRMAAIMASLLVLVAMQILGPFARYLPRSALAGVLIVTAYRMIDQAEIRRILQGSTGDAVIMIVTFLGTLFLHIETAVLIGILLSFMRYVMRTSTPRIQAVVPDDTYKHFDYNPERDNCPQLGVIEILGSLYFGAVNHVEDFVLDYASKHPEQRFLLIRMHNVNNCDFSGIHMLESIVRTYRDRGGDVFLVRASYRVRQRMKKTGFDRHLGLDNYLDEDEAISELFYHVLDPAMCIYECPLRVFKECQNLPKRLDLIGFLPEQRELQDDLKLVSPSELWSHLHDETNKQPPVVIDVREPREYRHGHIPEAQSVPLPQVASLSTSLVKEQPLVLVCRTSRRSRRAACALISEGHTNVSILDGGMLAWESTDLLIAIDTFKKSGDK
jgi:SulP family sulfate permease